jgi:hypothetical protein
MKTLDIDQPIKLGLGFWVTYALLALPTFWITKPWFQDYPMYARIADALLLPFLAAIFVYCLFLFARAVVWGGPRQRMNFWIFLAVIACAATFLGLCYLEYGSNHTYFYPPFIAVFFASLAYRLFRRRAPAPSSDPGAAPNANPAGNEHPKTEGSN